MNHQYRRRSIRLKGYDYSRVGAYFVTICTQDRACLFGNVVDGEMRLNDAGRMVEQWWIELNRKFPNVQTDEYVIMPNHFHGIIVIQNDPAGVRVVRVGADLRVCPYPNKTRAHGTPTSAPAGQSAASVDANAGQSGVHTGAPMGAHAGAHAGQSAASVDANAGQSGVHAGAPIGAHAGAHAGQSAASVDAPTGAHTRAPKGAHTGAPLPEIVQWFKTMTTNGYIRGVKQFDWMGFNGRLWQRNYYEHIIRDDESLWRIRDYIRNNPNRWREDRENPYDTGAGEVPKTKGESAG